MKRIVFPILAVALFFPPLKIPPSRDRSSYCNNAESYLKIGEAMGEAMIRLEKGQASR